MLSLMRHCDFYNVKNLNFLQLLRQFMCPQPTSYKVSKNGSQRISLGKVKITTFFKATSSVIHHLVQNLEVKSHCNLKTGLCTKLNPSTLYVCSN